MGPRFTVSGHSVESSTHIVGKRDLYPSQLSGGQQQLVAVARSSIANVRPAESRSRTGPRAALPAAPRPLGTL